jgi:hypothetical protein
VDPWLASCGFNQRPEDGSRRFILINGPFRVPLYREHEMIRRSSFERFDDSVLRRARDHAQPIADGVRRLVMTGIDRDDE